jgi:hypothetical protein
LLLPTQRTGFGCMSLWVGLAICSGLHSSQVCLFRHRCKPVLLEIFVGADFETHAEERRRFAIINIPRHLFSEATGQMARRAATKDR